jgi:hypothetical protein
MPNRFAPLDIQGGAFAGDLLRLTVPAGSNPVFTPNGADAGTYAFSDGSRSVTYSGFETASRALAGDFSDNGVVGQEDYQVWRADFGSTSPPAAGDANADGRVDGADYVIWRKNLGATLPAAGSGSVIAPGPIVPPEPKMIVAATAGPGAAAILPTPTSFIGAKESLPARGHRHMQQAQVAASKSATDLTAAAFLKLNIDHADRVLAQLGDDRLHRQDAAFGAEIRSKTLRAAHRVSMAWADVLNELVTDLTPQAG